MIGQMRDKITFKTPVNTPVGGGGTSTTYNDVLTDWCQAKQYDSTREQVEQQTALKTVYRFTLRCRAGFVPDKSMLVVYEGKDYTINGVDEINERGRYWRITAAALK
jgi:SPP1 family predicted phage head-tail adaptor